MSLTVGSLFSGIGGLDLGLERAGMEVRWQSEIDPYACNVLNKHWPDVPNLGDVTTIDWESVERVDLICGGYPCQPFSLAGFRDGDTDVERHLWPYFRAAIGTLRPRYALLENVAGHLSLGFDDVLADLADLGFDAEWSVVSACAVGAPHVRRRLFCLAHAEGGGRERGWFTPDENAQSVAGEGPVEGAYWSLGDRPSVTRVVDGVPHRVDRLRALGNAVVPQVAEFIGRRVLEALVKSLDNDP